MEFVVKDERVGNQKSKHKEERTDDRTFAFSGWEEEQDSKGQREAAFRNIEDPETCIFMEVKARDSFKEGMVESVTKLKIIFDSKDFVGLWGIH